MIVARSKLVPDFALSLHVIHLIVVFLYTGSVPQNLMWWAVMIGSSALATSLGIWGCRYRELKPISFGGNGGVSTNNAGAGGNGEGSSAAAAGEDGHIGDEEQGFSRGRGRGRGRDGGGEYEMVKMNGESSRLD